METGFASDETFTQESFWRWVRGRPWRDVHRYELIGGHIVMSPPASARHGAIGARLVARLARYVEANGLGLVFDSSAGFEFPSGDTLEPDVSFVSRERLAAVPRPIPDHCLRLTPELVVEVLSRGGARRDREEKRSIYARNGVLEYWIVDPAGARVEIYRLRAGALELQFVYETGGIVSSVLPGLAISVEELFDELA